MQDLENRLNYDKDPLNETIPYYEEYEESEIINMNV